MGDANASIPTVQPVFLRPMWGANPASASMNSVSFVSQVSIELGMIEIDPLSVRIGQTSPLGITKAYGLQKRVEAVKGCRTVKKSSMKWNAATPKLTVDPETYAVTVDGVHADIAPATTLPLGRNYNIF